MSAVTYDAPPADDYGVRLDLRKTQMIAGSPVQFIGSQGTQTTDYGLEAPTGLALTAAASGFSGTFTGVTGADQYMFKYYSTGAPTTIYTKVVTGSPFAVTGFASGTRFTGAIQSQRLYTNVPYVYSAYTSDAGVTASG